MSDPELEALRQRRLAQLQQQGGQQQDGGEKEEERRQAMQDAKQSILAQVLSQEARSRLNTLLVAKPERGARIEATIIQMARTGQLRGKLSEQELIGLLEQFSDSKAGGNKVKFDRRRAALDSDSD